jgi:hypothetical protein
MKYPLFVLIVMKDPVKDVVRKRNIKKEDKMVDITEASLVELQKEINRRIKILVELQKEVDRRIKIQEDPPPQMKKFEPHDILSLRKTVCEYIEAIQKSDYCEDNDPARNIFEAAVEMFYENNDDFWTWRNRMTS